MVLKANQLRHAYGRREVLRGVTFDAPPGALVGVVGENGAGKTRLSRILCGELTAAGGTTELDGRMGTAPSRWCSTTRSPSPSTWSSSRWRTASRT